MCSSMRPETRAHVSTSWALGNMQLMISWADPTILGNFHFDGTTFDHLSTFNTLSTNPSQPIKEVSLDNQTIDFYHCPPPAQNPSTSVLLIPLSSTGKDIANMSSGLLISSTLYPLSLYFPSQFPNFLSIGIYTTAVTGR